MVEGLPLLCLLLAAAPARAREPALDLPLATLDRAFPRSVEVREGGRRVEFCPDNTCDAFAAKRGVARQEVAAYAFLHTFYFSDFLFLAAWRQQEEPSRLAREILAAPRHRACRRAEDRETARCILRRLARGDRIRVFFVRYDERERNEVPVQAP